MTQRDLFSKPQNYNAYAAGNKVFGGGRSMPTIGAVDPSGYRERDLRIKARRNAVLRRLKSNKNKKYMSSEWLGGSNA